MGTPPIFSSRCGTLRHSLWLGAALAAVLPSCRGAAGWSRPDPTPVAVTSALSAGVAVNRFGFDLYAQLRRGDGDLVVSPFSAATALAMISGSARGQTAAEMARVLHVEDLAAAQPSFGALLSSLGGTEGPESGELDAGAGSHPVRGTELHIADRVWVQQGARYNEDFLALLRERYWASLGLTDFERAADDSRQAINAWVSAQTHGRIADLLAPGTVGSLTRLVLTNAVYFLGRWLLPFAEEGTRVEDFASPGTRSRVSMMRQTAHFAYAEVDGMQLVELPYVGGSLAMVVVLPGPSAPLDDAESRIGSSFDRWVAALSSRRVDLWLPRWRLSYGRELKAPLEALGMRLAFGPNADFSGLAAGLGLGLSISAMVQKAFIEVNERGTEAVAATGMTVSLTALLRENPPPVLFHADRPFLYLLRDRISGAVLFLGRVEHP